ncbi:hypothetical protein N7474_002077 [Penicillium riverlandense]|uniref:uncharacterized protein n=1 Tax=Penicillium riverlandense TaxID=1903569 RepID=UPI00254711D7|nr:uncharacterized protein N7474_002077 [Penicillium riverlandense]KAJ5833766.1 hypothetical protein N7474_002077 [Penicillium riverlandense]
MSRRPPPREYYSSEEEIYEVDRSRERERERPPRPRRRDRDRIIGDDVEVDVDYHRRRRSSPPLEDDLEERLRLREREPPRPRPRPPRDFMREALSSPPRERERGPMVRRRSREELVEEFSPERPRPVSPAQMEREMGEKVYIRPPGPRRRPRPRSREVDVDEEVLLEETEIYKRGGGRRRRSTQELEIEEDDVVFRHREREGDPRRRSTRKLEIEDDDVILRRREEGDPRRRGYESEEEIRIRDRKSGGGRRHDDESDEELYIRSSRPRRPPPREVTEEIVILGGSDEENRRSSRRRRGEFMFEDDEVVIRRKPGEPPYSNPRFEDDQFQPILARSDDDDDELDLPSRRPLRDRPRPRLIDSEDDEEAILMRKYEKDRARREGRRDVDVDIQWKRGRGSARERSSSVEPIRAPPIHQDVFTHHRHIDHGETISALKWGFADELPGMKASRSVRGSSPEFRSGRGRLEELDIHRRSTRNGVRSEEDIVLERDKEDSISPSGRPSPEFQNPWEPDETSFSRLSNKSVVDESESLLVGHSQSRAGKARSVRDIEEEMPIRSSRKEDIEPMNDTTDEWSVVRSPSKPDLVEMTGALTSRGDSGRGSERVAGVGQQVMNVKDERDSRWTEITKNLVVREAIERMGYEYEETRMFYYIFSYLEPRDIDELVDLSDEIRQARRRRIREIHRERASLPPPSASLDRLPPRPRLLEEKRIRERDWVVDAPRR